MQWEIIFISWKKNIPVVIPLNKRRAKILKDGNLNLSSNAIPLCKAGKEMRRHYFKKERMTHVYCCPIKRGSRKNGEFRYVTHREECPLDTLCEPDAVLAPTLQVCTKDNPRFYPVIPRGSKRYKKLTKERTGTDRSNSFNIKPLPSFSIRAACIKNLRY